MVCMPGLHAGGATLGGSRNSRAGIHLENIGHWADSQVWIIPVPCQTHPLVSVH